MIPWVVARELRETLLDYLRSTWSLSDRAFEEALFAFLAGPGGLFQGPYLRIGLPFAPSPAGVPAPLDVAPPYPPHLHQLQAWQRLSSRNQEPRATLITTGTGSGKTECFLYPILDHVQREARVGRKGIKAIVLYPMNALASDQASRFAAAVDADERLRGKVTVGLFVGGEGQYRTMGRDHVIDRNDYLREHPPDVLLTNYRMLDLLLQRPKDAPLWTDNRPETLRYVVLDELHTYDGAQGTDVACLIRRLAQRLGSGERICPVGTSATVGAGVDSREELLRFAATLFDQAFDDDAFIGETRIEARALFEGEASPETYPSTPGPWPQPGERAEEHVANALRAWFPGVKFEAPLDRVELGRRALELPLVREVLRLAGGVPLSLDATIERLAEALPLFRAAERDAREGWLASALTLLSYAQRRVRSGALPLVQVQATLWVREVRKLLVRVGGPFEFRFRDESPAPPGELWLPRYSCRDCGHGGWLTAESGPNDTLAIEYADVAHAYRERATSLRLLWTPVSEEDDANVRVAFVSAPTRRLLSKPVEGLELPEVRVAPPDDGTLVCPGCDARDTLIMLAARSTTLSSVAIGHLFTTPLNTDRKLLTFSDSVQDASHRAGFFGARTYRFALRSALLAAVPQDGEIPLADLGPATWRHWTAVLGKPGLSAQAELVAKLLPGDLDFLSSVEEWHDELDEFSKRRQQAAEHGEHVPDDVPEPSAALVSDLGRRLAWEATRELGVATRIGRTLEQSGCVSVTVDPVKFEAAIPALAGILRERLGLASPPGAPAVRSFLAGLVNRMRLRGAIADPLLDSYVASGGTGFMLTKAQAPLLSPFTRATSRPIWLTNARKAKNFDSFESPHRTWLSDWAARSLGLGDASQTSELYRLALPALARLGILVERATTESGLLAGSKASAWGLSPSALRVSRRTSLRRCDACGMELPVVEGSFTDVLGQPCPRFRCRGTVRERTATPGRALPVATYYRRFYEKGELGRVWSREHTGLLAREAREDLELEFKQLPRPDSPNLLSCTPTLEMGIDIGDLSATLLCSVPPSTSNYVQRVGRAGRKTGNALVLAFAATRAHDLYFFQQPIEAMAGAIHPPGCYLSAPEVLKRQALAFCFDTYARMGGKTPPRVTDMLRGEEGKRFPAPMLAELRPQLAALGDRFVEMFRRADLHPEARAAARGFFEPKDGGPSLVERELGAAVDRARGRREDLIALIKRVDTRRRELREAEEANTKGAELVEDELARLHDEGKFLRGQLQALTDADFFLWLTEEGCLPNYAFPERGVRLDVHVRKEGATSEPEHHTWVRPPAAALTELAPFNTFYASARRVRVDGIAVQKGGAVPTWAFCRRCHHVELAVQADAGATRCPSCGDEGWSDVGLRRRVVVLTESFSLTRHRDAVVGDDAEKRDRTYYERVALFEAEKKAREAWANEEAGFGFELQPRLVVRELNLGPQNVAATKSLLAGRPAAEVNFLVCAECGQAQVPAGTQRGLPHDPHRGWCAERKKQPSAQRIIAIHLMREVSSEALRLVVPLAATSDGGDIANLRALLRLGLRRLYGGEPDFLEVREYDEPLVGGEGRRRYLVVLDRVPGGTGMLAELAVDKGAKLKLALERAHDALRACACRSRQPAARACYQCLYAYREGDDLPLLDRERALDLCETLLGAFERLRRVDGVGTMSQSEVLESELEHRFVAELEARVVSRGGEFRTLEKGRYELRLGKRAWSMSAQIELGADQVAVPCRPDFLLRPAEPANGARPVAVFADGLAFHVVPGAKRGRLADDARKRAGIAASGAFLTWSLTWKDVVSGTALPLPRWLGDGPVVQTLHAMASRIDAASPSATGEKLESLLPILEPDPLAGLLSYLEAPSRLDQLAALTGLVLLSKGRRQPLDRVTAAQRSARTDASARRLAWDETSGEQAVASLEFGEHAALLCDASSEAMRDISKLKGALRVTLRLEDDELSRMQPSFEASWRRWLHAWNLLQALLDAALVTREAQEEEPVVASVRAPVLAPGTEAGARLDPRLEEATGIADEHLRGIVLGLLAAHPNLEAPAVPFELRPPEFDLADDVELGWPARRVAAYFDHQRKQADALARAGWTTFAIERKDTAEALAAALGLGGTA